MFIKNNLKIADKSFNSRLMLGTGKYRDFGLMQETLAASGAEIITVSIRRVELGSIGHVGILEALDWSGKQLLPNTAGCRTAEEAVRVARLGQAMTGSNWVKLEVIPDARYLLPDPVETFLAAQQLVDLGFAVLPYMPADPVLAQKLEVLGCATLMPLGSPIGSGQGIVNAASIKIIVQQAQIPVVVDAGLRVPSQAACALEWGASAVLLNTAIAEAQDPPRMAYAFRLAVEAGYLAFCAGYMEQRTSASASSPMVGVPRPPNALPDPEVPA